MHILLETNEYLVLDKPAGISVHPDGKSDQETITDWIIEHYPDLKDVGEPMEVEYKGEMIQIVRPGIVHRLDKDTTGCLLVAKTQPAFLHFKKQFQEHTIQKIYHCFVYGALKGDKGIINKPIGRSGGDIRKWTTGKGARGTVRDAVTEYNVLAQFGVEEGKGSTEIGTYSFVECRPKTGRTHQIRVHMKSLNHPIIEDSLYAEKNREREPQALGFERLALHARSLSFTDMKGESIMVEAPYPLDFKDAIKTVAKKG